METDFSRSPLPASNASYSKVDSRFAFDLLRALQTTGSRENLAVCPPSIEVALAVVCAGASGRSRAEIAALLGVGDDRALFDRYRPIVRTLIDDVEGMLCVATGLWIGRQFAIKPEFTAAIREQFSAHLRTCDFSDASSVDLINAWVGQQTAGKIAQIVAGVQPHMRAILVNVLCFRCKWQNPFEMSYSRPFYLDNGSTQPHQAMLQLLRTAYLQAADFKAVLLTYSPPRFQMVVIMPDDMRLFLPLFTMENWNRWLGDFTYGEVILTLPKFSIAAQPPIKEVLQQLGVNEVFSPGRADLSRICVDGLFISDVLHQARIDVDERGTEAAAVTNVRFCLGASGEASSKPFLMDVNRPFFYAVADRETGTILFAGVVQNPKTCCDDLKTTAFNA